MYELNEKNKIKSYDLVNDGIKIVNHFLSKEELYELNRELDNLFLKPSFNGSSGCTVMVKNFRVNYKCINLPTATIRSLNLLEKACLVRECISKNLNTLDKNIKLTGLEIYEEKNETPLFWHTDNREGTFRAFIYLEGGEIDSGAFRYMIGTHRRDYFVHHKLKKSQIKQNENNIFTADCGLGSLIIADINGFHCNSPRKKTRRVILLEYQFENKNYAKSSILIPSYWINDKVKLNLDMFDNKVAVNQYDHLQDRRLHVINPSLDAFLFVNLRLIRPWILKQIKFWTYQLRKFFK